MEVVTFSGPQPVYIDPNLVSVLSNSTVAANGSFTSDPVLGGGQVSLIINITGTPTGGSPTLQFSVQEVDPVDGVTAIGSATTSNIFNSASYQVISLASTNSCRFKVTWTVGGSTPSFGGVNVSLSNKIGGGSAGSNASVGSVNVTAPSSATMIGGVDDSGNLSPFSVSPAGHLPIAGNALRGYAGEVVGWSTTAHVSPTVDPVGALYTRGQVMTDEGSFTDDFRGSSLTTALTGTLGFTNNSDQVVGVGTKFLTELDYYSVIKKSGDADTLYVQVSSVEDDTHLTLLSPYQGTTQSGQTGVKSKWITSVGTGASLSVGSSLVTIACGTTSGALVGLWTVPDYIPFLGALKVAVDNRRANQNIFIGWFDTAANPTPGLYAAFLLDGTTNTTVKCVSATSTAAADTQTTSVTLPGGVNSTASNVYRVAPWQGQVAFYVNEQLVAVHAQHVIPPYADIRMGMYNVNTGVPAGATGITLDSVIYESIDRLDARVYNTNADFMQVTANGRTTTGMPVPLQVSAAGIAVVSGSGSFTVAQATAASLKAQVSGAITPADAFANPTTAITNQALLQGFNGTTWDRLKAGANNADAEAVATLGILAVKNYLYGFNGTTWDRLRSSTANGLVVDVSRVQGSVAITAASLPLPTGAATEATLDTLLADSTFTTRIPVQGQAAMAASVPVVIASDQSAIPVSGTFAGSSTPADAFANPTTAQLSQSFMMGFNGTTWDRLRSTTANGLAVDVTRVSGSVTVAQSTAANLLGTMTQGPGSGAAATYWYTRVTDGTNSMPTGDAAARGIYQRVTDGTNTAAVKASSTAAATTDPALVVSVSPNSTVPVKPATASTSSVTQVASSATSVTLKASNSARLGLMIFNDSTQVLYVKLGGTASSTSYTVKVLAGGYYEAPFGYTGVVDGIWASANGNAYVTEVTA